MAARGSIRRKAAAGSKGLSADETLSKEPPAEVAALADAIRAAKGAVLASYREPLGGHWVTLAALPIDKVSATPYQRELSPAHAKRLSAAIAKIERFLDPVIAVHREGAFWTPNGMHRLEAMRSLGARSITALVVGEPEIAFRILALNTEKAHNLRDRSLEVIRMARAIAADPERKSRAEKDWAFEFEEPAFLTLGICYEANGRFSGGAYLSVVKRCEAFSGEPVGESLKARAARAKRLAELDEAVTAAVKRLKEAGFTSGYLKPFVVARVNPLRFIRPAKPGQKSPPAEFEKTIARMIEGAKKLDAGKVRPADFAAAAAMASSSGGSEE